MALTTLTTGPSAQVNGTITIPATAMDSTANSATLQFDISQHLAGNPAAVTAEMDVSLDGGVTWTPLRSVGRDQGYPLDNSSKTPNLCSITGPLPGVGNPQRMVRATLTTTGPVTTSMQVAPAAVTATVLS